MATRAGWAAGLLGFAFGGFLDGILLHQVLQWHHFLSGWEGRVTPEQLRFHMLWDGLFHAAHYVVLAAGLALVLGRRGTGALPVGWFAIGFGAWHVLDGVVSHWVLGLHRTRQDSPNVLLWDLGFVAFGLAALALGWWLRRRGPALPAGAVALLLVAAGAGAALPARGPVLAAIQVPPGGEAPAAALRLAAAAGADLVGSDAGGRTWLFRTAAPDRLRLAALSAGAVPVRLPPLPGCLTPL